MVCITDLSFNMCCYLHHWFTVGRVSELDLKVLQTVRSYTWIISYIPSKSDIPEILLKCRRPAIIHLYSFTFVEIRDDEFIIRCGGGRGGRVHFQLSLGNFYDSPVSPEFMTPTSPNLTSSNLHKPTIEPILCPSDFNQTCMEHKEHLFTVYRSIFLQFNGLFIFLHFFVLKCLWWGRGI